MDLGFGAWSSGVDHWDLKVRIRSLGLRDEDLED
jgi:hypothetical protein